MPPALYTVKLAAGEANLTAAAQKLRVQPADLDANFGVVPVAPAAGLYAVLVQASASPVTDGDTTDGPFADPSIAPVGAGTSSASSAPAVPNAAAGPDSGGRLSDR
jgi:hypothetical protein